MSGELIVAIGGILIQTGILIATIKFLGERQTEQHKDTQKDLNGLGRKERAIMAELIIQAKDHPEFPVIVRKLINGI